MTYLALLQKLEKMNPAQLAKPVQLRDYDNSMTFNGLDILPVGIELNQFQIGFNCAELEGE